MKRVESLGSYFLGDNAFANPDDYFAFMSDEATLLEADAKRCFKHHGRGIVCLQGPRGPFLDSFYMLCEHGDVDKFGPEAQEDWQEYDPTREMLIGVTNPEGSFLWFWRCVLR